MKATHTERKTGSQKVSGLRKFLKDPLSIFRQPPPPANIAEMKAVILRNTVLDLIGSLQREDNALEELIGRLRKQQKSTQHMINQIARLHPNAANTIKRAKNYPDIEFEKDDTHV